VRPSAPQAIFLRALAERPDLIVRRRFGVIDFLDAEGKLIESGLTVTRPTVATCALLGWLGRIEGPRSDRYRYADYGDTTYYTLADVGRRAVAGLPDSAFEVRRSVRPSVRGEAGRVLRALRLRHQPPEWVFIVEAPILTPDAGLVHIDALALNCYWSEKYRRVGYEVKVSRGDFLGELKQPEKTRRSATCCSHFFFAVPSGLVKPTEIPDPYGLITVGPKGGARIAKRSKLPDSQPTWGYLATLLRRLVDEQEAVP
jgi:hypothetical protein